MQKEAMKTFETVYRQGLLDDTLPFWIDHCVDREHGGFMVSLDRDGSVLDTDKGMWQQCRFTWLLATLYNTVEARPEWIELAKHGVDFIRRYGFDVDGRMFFHVTREGKPLRKRRYLFTESFGAIALAAYAKAAGDAEAAEQAQALCRLFVRGVETPGFLEPKGIPGVRDCRALGPYMIMINMARTLLDTVGDPECDHWIEHAIETIRRDFVKPDLKAVMEIVRPDGQVIDHFDGRTLLPGHAIEAAWFILHEARCRNNDADLIQLGTTILDWMWDRGWDTEYGGILYFRDVKGLPVQEYWHDMKFWWPHNETIIATLLAHHLTGQDRYLERHRIVHDWAYTHFPDPEHGEWFGYLHRDGRLSVPLKGNLWKGPFHLPRMQWYCWQLLQEVN